MSTEKVIIHTDGAARGNPGPAAIGITIKDSQGKLLAGISRAIGVTTNNQAEYRALIAGLEKAAGLGARHVEVKADSELVVRQVNGVYRVKNAELKPLYEKVRRLAAGFEGFKITHVPRGHNAEADALANRALDGKPG